ncbi:MAG: hypothetical protein PWP46_583 [Fusobacteriaceae bacterium]|jgi:ADP-ribose pyrophosphatase YjhB (NUDIX family)|nr:hydrolase [Fusobacteriales bacterium]MDN5303704.1 hypothetical protein [Fusobacteriaceae bacterium]
MKRLLEIAKQLQAISQSGLYYSENEYDLDRYRQIEDLSVEMIELLTNNKAEEIKLVLCNDDGYKTPKVDVRGVVFDEQDRILMVKEKIDGKWSIPGGWSDIGYSPKKVAEKEVFEEAGLIVEAQKLLAVLDKSYHKHPTDINHVYKMFISCKVVGGELKKGMETLDVGYFDVNNLPELSITRITKEQIDMLYKFHKGIYTDTICD